MLVIGEGSRQRVEAFGHGLNVCVRVADRAPGIFDNASSLASKAVTPLALGVRGISERARQISQVRNLFVDALQDVLVGLFFRLRRCSAASSRFERLPQVASGIGPSALPCEANGLPGCAEFVAHGLWPVAQESLNSSDKLIRTSPILST